MQDIKQMEKECPMKGRMSQCRVDDICIHNLYIKDDILQKDEKTDMQDIKQLIQKDLDKGKFVQICSNETSFKDYIFEKLNLAVEQEKANKLLEINDGTLAVFQKKIREQEKERLTEAVSNLETINGSTTDGFKKVVLHLINNK